MRKNNCENFHNKMICKKKYLKEREKETVRFTTERQKAKRTTGVISDHRERERDIGCLSEMAPKKKPQKQANTNNKKKSNSNSSTSSSAGPRLQISAENENRLRRLLLNTARPDLPAAAPAQGNLSKAHKARKLKAVYEKLSCEGFGNDQIELALSSLKVI